MEFATFILPKLAVANSCKDSRPSQSMEYMSCAAAVARRPMWPVCRKPLITTTRQLWTHRAIVLVRSFIRLKVLMKWKSFTAGNALFRGCIVYAPFTPVIWIYADLQWSKYLPKDADFHQTVLVSRWTYLMPEIRSRFKKPKEFPINGQWKYTERENRREV